MPFAQKVESVSDINSATSMYWLVENDVVITNYDVFDFIPDRHTAMYCHQWKWNKQYYHTELRDHSRQCAIRSTTTWNSTH